MDVFRIGLRGGFHLPSLGPHALLNNGTRLFLASGAVVVCVCGGGGGGQGRPQDYDVAPNLTQDPSSP